MNSTKEHDQHIRETIRLYAKEISVPDIDESLINLTKRINVSKRRRYSLAAVIVLVLLTMGAFFSEPVRAVPTLLRKTFSILIGDTLKLHQRGYFEDEGTILIKGEPSVQYFTKLENLRKESLPGIFIPDNLFEDVFIYAEIHRKNDLVIYSRMELSFAQGHDIILEQFLSNIVVGRGRVVDVEDYETTKLNILDDEILVFSHKSGLTILEWDAGTFIYELYGYLDLDKMLELARELGLFK
jgi:hypothetical protein